MNESSIRTIWKNKDEIIRQGIQTAKFDAKTNCLEKIYCQARNGAAFAHLGWRLCKTVVQKRIQKSLALFCFSQEVEKNSFKISILRALYDSPYNTLLQ